MQRIESRVGTRSSGYKLRIIAVYLVDNTLHVISKMTIPNDAAGSSLSTAGEEIIVKTGVNEQLPTIHYLINSKKNSEQYTHPDFIILNDIAEINELISKGELIYQARGGSNCPKRIDNFENTRPHIKSLKFADTKLPQQDVRIENIFNIFSMVDGIHIQLVCETISERGKNIFSDISTYMVQKSGITGDILKKDLLMATDYPYCFYAVYKSIKTQYHVKSTEFHIPRNKPELIHQFLSALESYILTNIRKVKDDDRMYIYTHVQLSQQSIFACFDDIICSEGFGNTIENEMGISMEEFINKPGTFHDIPAIIPNISRALLNPIEFGLSPYQPLKRQSELAENTILQEIGISTVSTNELLLEHPALISILSIMQKAGLFSQDRIKNKLIFGTFISTTRYVRRNLDGPNTMNELLRLYTILGQSTSTGHLLNAKVNKHIFRSVITYNNIGAIVNLLDEIQLLDNNIINKLFESSEHYLAIWQKIKAYENPQEGLALIFKADVNPLHIKMFIQHFPYNPEWLTRELFYKVLENISQSENIFSGLRKLYQANLLDTHLDLFLQNPTVTLTFRQLMNCNLNSSINLIASMKDATMVAAVKVVNACNNIQLLQRPETFLKFLLVNKQLIPIIDDLCAKLGDRYDYHDPDNSPECKALDANLKSFLFDIGINKKLDQNKLFSTTSLNINEVINSFIEKYYLITTTKMRLI